MTILFYKTNEPYGFLNNFKKARMFIFDKWWNNVEAPYQSRKCAKLSDIDLIHQAKTPREARDLGQIVECVDNWDRIKYDVMHQCVLAKFVQHKDLREQLLATGTEDIVEDSDIDAWWGRGPDNNGLNNLGRILMHVRELLKGE